MAETKFGLIHAAVVLGDRLDKIPVWGVGLLLAALAAHVAWAWTPALGAGLAWAYAVDAAMLALLPRRDKSFGPINAPLIALAVLRWGLTAAAGLILPHSSGAALAVMLVQAGISAAAWYGLWVEPFRLGVTRLEIESAKLDGQPALRILHLSDLHVERITQRERRLLELADQLRPDLVVFTGDFLNLFDRYTFRQNAAPKYGTT